IDRDEARVEFLVASLVVERNEPLARLDPEVVAALRADVRVPRDLLFVDDLAAAVALRPEPLGHLETLLFDGGLGPLFLTEPAHRKCEEHKTPHGGRQERAPRRKPVRRAIPPFFEDSRPWFRPGCGSRGLSLCFAPHVPPRASPRTGPCRRRYRRPGCRLEAPRSDLRSARA